MASWDRSQKFGFAYTTKTLNFNKDSLTEAKAPSAADLALAEPAAPPPAVRQIRENLDRLQALHQRIHAMLEELSQLTPAKKDKKKD